MHRIFNLNSFGRLAGIGLFVAAATLVAQTGREGNAWLDLTETQQGETEVFAEDYKQFIDECRSALSTVHWVRREAESRGYRTFEPGARIQPGDKYLIVNRERAACLVVIGRRPVREGMRIIGTHIDAPHISLKPNPVVDAQKFALLQTTYHGGIKRYQWVNIPLALTGRVDKADGSTVWVNLGLDPDDPVLILPDLAPHVDREYRDRTAPDVIKPEEMDPVIGSLPGADDEKVSEQVYRYLEERYDIAKEDMVSAELMLVPALKPRDVGVDRALVGAYGHDDRVCSYAGIRASFDAVQPEYTTITYLTNNEEVGSVNNTGARSFWFRYVLSELLAASEGKETSELLLNRALSRSTLISADGTTGVNPNYPDVQELTNAARMHQGFVIKLYGQGFNANSEFTAQMRKLLDKAGVRWQTHMYKVAGGGGGTIGGFLSVQNIEVIDAGIPLLSMHATYELISKADLFHFYNGCKAYYEDATPWTSFR